MVVTAQYLMASAVSQCRCGHMTVSNDRAAWREGGRKCELHLQSTHACPSTVGLRLLIQIW